MLIYPALDLLDGKVVRLQQGDFSRQSGDHGCPLMWIDRFIASGVKWVHLVDLSGAKDPKNVQWPLLESILRRSDLKIQVGGGLRELAQVDKLLRLGADRVVLGSVAFLNPDFVSQAIAKWGPDRFCIALDVLSKPSGFEVQISGWTKSTGADLFSTIGQWAERGVKRFMSTDIARDGMLEGPNIQLYRTLKTIFPNLEFQASGGTNSLQDLSEISKLGLHSTIVGRSILSGKIQIEEALAL